MLADEVNIGRDTVRKSVVEDLQKRKICSRFASHSLTSEQKNRRIAACRDLIVSAHKSVSTAQFVGHSVAALLQWHFERYWIMSCWIGDRRTEVRLIMLFLVTQIALISRCCVITRNETGWINSADCYWCAECNPIKWQCLTNCADWCFVWFNSVTPRKYLANALRFKIRPTVVGIWGRMVWWKFVDFSGKPIPAFWKVKSSFWLRSSWPVWYHQISLSTGNSYDFSLTRNCGGPDWISRRVSATVINCQFSHRQSARKNVGGIILRHVLSPARSYFWPLSLPALIWMWR
jgi:hypothetical protein